MLETIDLLFWLKDREDFLMSSREMATEVGDTQNVVDIEEDLRIVRRIKEIVREHKDE